VPDRSELPVNDGFYRLIDIRSRPGSDGARQHPAAVAAGWEIAMQLCDLLFKALAPAAQIGWWRARRVACATSPSRREPGHRRVLHVLRDHRGGYGATLTTDGMDAVQAHFQNTENAPVEETEANYPVRILRYALIETRRAAPAPRGPRRPARLRLPGHAPTLDPLDKARYAPWGLFGGGAAAAGPVRAESGDAGRARAAVQDHVPDGAARRVSVQTPRRGTEGPLARRSGARWRGRVQGKIAPSAPARFYGVVVDPVTQALDAAATAAARRKVQA